MNQKEDCVSIGGPLSKTASRGPRHHQYEGILRYAQKAHGDISWTIDRAEFDELIALKKDSAPALLEFLMVSTKCAGGLGSQFLYHA